jgi:hypothetical protein
MAKELMEIGGFITEGAEIVNHDNTLSGNGTVDSPLGVLPGYNETVLWSGNSATATLSESLDNFEKVDITYTYWTDNYTTRTLYGWSGKPTFTEGWFDNNAAVAGIFITRLTANDAHTVIGTNANKYWNPPAGGGLADALSRFAITKVVGINRKA